MTTREQLILELQQVPEEIIQTMFEFLHRLQATRQIHPLAQFAGILSDSEAQEIQQVVIQDCRQVEVDEW